MVDRLDIISYIVLVLLAKGPHPFPSRTRQLSPSAPMILFLGKVGQRENYVTYLSKGDSPSSEALAQDDANYSKNIVSRRCFFVDLFYLLTSFLVSMV
jgi:hypothetical protein